MNETVQNAADTNTENRLYAGKYKTIDDLEAGYRASSTEIQRVLQEKQTLEKKLTEREHATTLPTDYHVAEEHASLEGLDGIKSQAKALGLTQTQFERYMQDILNKRTEAQRRQDLLRAAAGSDEKLTQVKTYLTNQLGDKLAISVFDTMTADEFHTFSKKAAAQLDSTRSFGGGVSTQPPASNREKMKAIMRTSEYRQGDAKAQEEVIKLAQASAKERHHEDVGTLKHQLTELMQRIDKMTPTKK